MHWQDASATLKRDPSKYQCRPETPFGNESSRTRALASAAAFHEERN
jgi:hypothetical protein